MRDLGDEEDFTARHAGGADAGADAFFGAVFPSGVDMAVAEFQCRRDEIAAVAELGSAEADLRHGAAVGSEIGDHRRGSCLWERP